MSNILENKESVRDLTIKVKVVVDADFVALRACTSLERLAFGKVGVTKVGLLYLKDLTNFQWLE